ncbi:hypothetical protein HmCmsJML280_03092 [Escherichia coli]|nr:hypothetical protein HmCmsJML280_03092 [Escherichia coli]
MVQPGNVGFALCNSDCMGGTIGQQLSSSWSAKLIINDRYLATLFAKTQHSFGEVGTARSINPTGTKDKVT